MALQYLEKKPHQPSLVFVRALYPQPRFQGKCPGNEAALSLSSWKCVEVGFTGTRVFS